MAQETRKRVKFSPRQKGPRTEVAIGEIGKIVERIYQRDPERFKKIVVWVHTMLKRRWEVQFVAQALKIFDEREAAGERHENWWPYLSKILEKNRTEQLQAESGKFKELYKKDMPNRMRTVLAEVLRRVLEE